MKDFYTLIVAIGLFMSCYEVYPQNERTKTNQKDYIDTILSNSIGSKNLLVATNVKFLNNKGLFILNAQSLVYEAKKKYSTYPQMLKYIGDILINNDTMIVEEFYSEWRKKHFRAEEVVKVQFVDEIALQGEDVFLQYFFDQSKDKSSGKLKSKEQLFGKEQNEEEFSKIQSAIQYYLFNFCIYFRRSSSSGDLIYHKYIRNL